MVRKTFSWNLVHVLRPTTLAAGQRQCGGWTYACPILSSTQENAFVGILKQRKVEQYPKPFNQKFLASEGTDNSNRQFAMLALWGARKLNLPLDFTFAQTTRRFRSNQGPQGWGYVLTPGNGSMTCVGLLGVAIGHGASSANIAVASDKGQDQRIIQGLIALSDHMKDPSDKQNVNWEPKGAINTYFLWSVERVGVLYSLKTIGGQDWYQWGVDQLLPAQKDNGSWLGRGPALNPIVDTSFALLFLNRSDLLPDMRENLQNRLKIVESRPQPRRKAGAGKRRQKKSQTQKFKSSKVPVYRMPANWRTWLWRLCDCGLCVAVEENKGVGGRGSFPAKSPSPFGPDTNPAAPAISDYRKR